MSEQQPYERYEKHEKAEKEEEKRREAQEKEEKSWDEKWRRDPLGAAVWAVILIWAGLVLIAQNVGLLEGLRFGTARPEAWPVIMIGAGMILLLEVLVRLLVPSYRRAVGGSLVFAVILIGVGLGSLFGWEMVWPLVLIAIGISLLLRGLIRGL